MLFATQQFIVYLTVCNFVFHGFFWIVLTCFMIYDVYTGKNGLTRAFMSLFIFMFLGTVRSISIFYQGHEHLTQSTLLGSLIQTSALSLSMLLILIEYTLIYKNRKVQ